MLTEIIVSLIVVLISIFLIIPGIVLAVVRRVVANEREETKEMFREIRQLLLDGGGKQSSETQENQFSQVMELKFKEVMENMERSSSRAVINPWEVTDAYGWGPNKQKKNRDSAEIPRDRDGRGKQSKS